MQARSNVQMAWQLLYCTYIALPILAGLDKYFYYLANWDMYVHNAIPDMFGITAAQVNMGVGIVEIAAGLFVFFMPRVGSYLVSMWLLVISVNLVAIGLHTVPGCVTQIAYYDIAIRDIGLAVGAYALALLS